MNLYESNYMKLGVRPRERKLSLVEELKGRNEKKFSAMVVPD